MLICTEQFALDKLSDVILMGGRIVDDVRDKGRGLREQHNKYIYNNLQ